MAQCFSYKETKTTTMKVAGILDTDAMVIHTDDGERSIKTLLSYFNGAEIDFSIKVKSERDLDEPLDFIPEDAE